MTAHSHYDGFHSDGVQLHGKRIGEFIQEILWSHH
jgi:hypothetical protein